MIDAFQLRWVLTQAWTAEVLATFHQIYTARLAALSATPINARQMQARCRTQLHTIEWHAQDTKYGPAFQRLHQLLHPTAPTPTQLSLGSHWLLYFDGGARGNPGPGGAGAALVHLSQAGPGLRWVSSTYHPSPTTNNVAEFSALRDGLQIASTFDISTLHVIGDSMLMIRALRSPLAPHLQDLHSQVCQHLDCFRHTHWHHHVRAHNKMADSAVNWAMDRQLTTSTPDNNTQLHRQVASYNYNDVTHWIMLSQCEPRAPS